MAQPVVKWAGGKRQILPEIKSLLPREFGKFHEPMLGGGALFFDLEPSEGTVNDINPRLVNLCVQIRDRPQDLVKRCREFREPEADTDPERDFHSKDRKGNKIDSYYYQQRALFNRRPNGEEFSELEEAALFLYLNRTCFNGLYRENQDGEFNVPSGDYSNPDWVQENRIRSASKVLEPVKIFNRQFSYVEEEASKGDVVYLDPPYKPMSSTASFTEYSAEGFGKKEQERLLETLRKLDDAGVLFITSNSGVMARKYRESRFDVVEVEAKRSINSDASSRDEVKEILSTNIPEERRRGPAQKKLG